MFKPILATLAGAAALTLAGCATHPANQTNSREVAKNSNMRVVCSSHAPVGSHIVKTQCVKMTEEQYKAYEKALRNESEKTQEQMQRRNSQYPRSKGSG